MKRNQYPAVPKGTTLLTLKDVACTLQLSGRRIAEIIADGEIPIVKIGRSVRILPVDLEKFILSHRSI